MVQLRKMPQLQSVSIPPGKPLETGLPSSDFIRASSLGVRDGPDGGPPPVFLSDLLIPSIFSFALCFRLKNFFLISSGSLRTVLNCLSDKEIYLNPASCILQPCQIVYYSYGTFSSSFD